MIDDRGKLLSFEEKRLETFKYFFDCYYFQGEKYEDISKMICEFKNENAKIISNQLINELEYIQRIDDWKRIKEFILKISYKDMPEMLIKSMVETILKILKEK